MSTKLISLRHVPDEEAAAIRALLNINGIHYYETPASQWGTSAAIIWLEDEQQQERANVLLDDFQQNYTQQQRATYAERLAQGRQPGLMERLKNQPIQSISLLLAAGIIAWFSIAPFLLPHS